MTLAASGDFLRANDPDVLRRLVVVEAASAAALPSATLEAAIAALGLPQVAEVTLTAADLAVLDTVPFELVPAPGAGKILRGISVTFLTLLDGGICPQAVSGSLQFYYASIAGQFIASVSVDAVWPVAEDYLNWEAPSAGYVSRATGENVGAELQAVESLLVPGAIATSSIGAAGTGYDALDELAIGDAVVRVDTVGGGGEVLTYTITTAGTNNVLGAAQATTGGNGADFTIDILTLDYSVNPMTLKVKTLYTVMDV